MTRTRKRRPDIDWPALEPHYRAGIKTLAAMGRELNVSPTAIRLRAAQNGWTRDLKGRIKAKVRALIEAAPALPSLEDEFDPKLVKTHVEPFADVVEAGALAVAQVVMAHRTSANRARRLTEKLFAELEAVTDHRGVFQGVFDVLANGLSTGDPMNPEGREKLWQAIRRATSLSGRAGTLKALAESLQKVTSIERQAFGMDLASPEAPEDDDKPASAVFDRYAEGMQAMRERFAAVSAARKREATTVEPKEVEPKEVEPKADPPPTTH